MTTWREMFPKGRFVVVKMEDRVSYAGGGHVGRRGEIVVLGAAEELGCGDSCELRDGLMVKGWPSGPRGGGTDADDHPLQGMVLHGCDSRAEAERWLKDFRRDCWKAACPGGAA